MINKILDLLKKYREQVAYLFFGGLTTLISWGLFSGLFYFVFGETRNLLCNVISEAVAITFAYVTNKIFVFQSKTNIFSAFILELLSFYGMRILSTFVNLGAMYLLVDLLSFEAWICKIAVNFVIIILNYLFSKLFIFKKTEDKNAEHTN